MSKEARILFIPDCYGWAFDNIAIGIKKYSRYNIDIISYDELGLIRDNGRDTGLLNNYEIIFYMNHCVPIKARNWLEAIRNRKGKFKFVYADWGHDISGLKHFPDVDVLIFGERKLYDLVKTFRKEPIYFIPEGIDTKLYHPTDRPPDRFVVGWAGNYKRPNKRTHLLKRIKYQPVKIQCDRTFVKGRSQQDMVNFYSSIDTYVLVSTVEGGQSTTILEAMACGLPVVSTDCGGEMKTLLTERWLVPVNPPKVVVDEMNKKLNMLKNNPDLRKEVGKKNRERIMRDKKAEDVANKIDGVIKDLS